MFFGLMGLGAAETISISSLKAIPRWGNGSCWVDTGGRIKNGCNTPQQLTFAIDNYLLFKTVSATVYTDAPLGKMHCQHASLKYSVSNYWAVDVLRANNGSINSEASIVYLPPWQVPYSVYQIDCLVPPGAQVMYAAVSWN